ncbi:response regulator transcription factor [Hydrogenimonas thermophila]|uniref:DNA-binding response regulator, OmpR family, contains REC and winged-helix (WHTH) domain n=1 Tax=Hydrogenimonas thermophila TaxID=223786 RepID=A0A1I5UZG4_9BACT|nr:response regulator transcription factor [Hydrogenimonas thermophila]WOE69785.1 response regulator transcription factor [Hydrogenimonas thermophila]WOE72300.1 response regulator transcription factor [Hydrogenimonas thermophila]SFQ00467.1 DNA-binding response regulator, OmpR family, contains REC and winged-helix (wHTH) domain [Hydrogenimonas thermophila]
MEKIKVLLVEDDELAAELIYNYLIDYGFDVSFAFNATESMEQIRYEEFDIAILDINLPDYSGLEVLKNIKNIKNIPVIVTSAYSDKNIKLMAFKYGACDYMIKPIDIEELEARIWVHLSKNNKLSIEEKIEKELFEIEGNSILFNGVRLDLTSIENEILTYLIKNKNRVVKREELSSILSLKSSDRSLDNHIKNIRKKIGDSGKEAKYLKTVYGVGYCFRNSQL